MRHPCWRAVIVSLATVAASDVLRAEEGDGLKAIASTAVRHDSNFFRLSSSQDAASLIGRSSKDETILSGTGGLRFDKQYGLQRIKLEAEVVDYRYQNFDYLNFTAFNYRGTGNWSVTPHLYGTVKASREQTLNSYADFRTFNQRNERVDTNYRADVTYELDARWRALGAVLRNASKNKLPLLNETSYEQDAVEVGTRYVLPSSSAAGIVYRKSDGNYTDGPVSTASLQDNGFSQDEIEIDGLWLVSPKTTATLRVGYRKRTHPNFSVRNFDGFYGNARVNWMVSAKTALTAAWDRDLYASQSNTFSFAQSDRFSLGPVWQVGSKTRLGLQVGATTRDYDGAPGLAPPENRRDRNYDATISVDWRPRPFVTVNAFLQNQRRSSTSPGLDYNANIVNVSAQFSF